MQSADLRFILLQTLYANPGEEQGAIWMVVASAGLIRQAE
jgi:hypothetical protein